jgi:hypothetical protein
VLAAGDAPPDAAPGAGALGLLLAEGALDVPVRGESPTGCSVLPSLTVVALGVPVRTASGGGDPPSEPGSGESPADCSVLPSLTVIALGVLDCCELSSITSGWPPDHGPADGGSGAAVEVRDSVSTCGDAVPPAIRRSTGDAAPSLAVVTLGVPDSTIDSDSPIGCSMPAETGDGDSGATVEVGDSVSTGAAACCCEVPLVPGRSAPSPHRVPPTGAGAAVDAAVSLTARLSHPITSRFSIRLRGAEACSKDIVG